MNNKSDEKICMTYKPKQGDYFKAFELASYFIHRHTDPETQIVSYADSPSQRRQQLPHVLCGAFV